MFRSLVLVAILYSTSVMATMKIGYIYPNNKKAKTIKVFLSEGKAYAVLKENKSEVSKNISLPLFEQIRKNFIKITKAKKKTEFSCPKRIQLSISFNKKNTLYCNSTGLKKSVAKLFSKIHEVILR